MRLLLLSALLLGCAHRRPAAASAQDRDLAVRLAAIPGGGYDAWDAAVKELMVQAYDRDRSGMIDAASEVNAVPCDVWRVLDEAISAGRGEPASLQITYINPPWLTHLIGVDQALEAEMYDIARACDLRGIDSPLTRSTDPGRGKAQPKQPKQPKPKKIRGGLSHKELYARLVAIPGGGHDAWDAAVKELMVRSYDADRSGMIDTPEEVALVPCDIWRLLDEAIYFGRGEAAASLRVTYLNPPWLTHLIGVDQAVEAEMFAVSEQCGLRMTGPDAMFDPRAMSGDDLAALLSTIPGGGSSEWDAVVKVLLVAAFDADGSGMLDSADEVAAVPCSLWQAIDDSIAQGLGEGTSLRATYIDRQLTHLLGVEPAVEAELIAIAGQCELRAGDGSGRDVRMEPPSKYENPLIDVPAPPGYEDLHARLAAIPDGGSGEWDAAVKPALVGAFDADGSGMIDAAAEVAAVPCEIWKLLDEAIAIGRSGSASLRVTYLNPPWLTHLIGVDKAVEAEMTAVVQRCGLR